MYKNVKFLGKIILLINILVIAFAFNYINKKQNELNLNQMNNENQKEISHLIENQDSPCDDDIYETIKN